jgi:hypothetical protein
MISNSFLDGIKTGIVGGLRPNLEWLLGVAGKEECFLGERSIWKYR